MKRIAKRPAFQGDVLLKRVAQLPSDAKRQDRKGPIVVAHSETGHHHSIDDSGVVMYESTDPLVAYLVLEGVTNCELVHHRGHDTHEALKLGGGVGAIYKVVRQREYVPNGWRRAID
jgi:hypothetical protein